MLSSRQRYCPPCQSAVASHCHQSMNTNQAGSVCAAHSCSTSAACIQAVHIKACLPCCRRSVGSTCHAALGGSLARMAKQSLPSKMPQRPGLCWQTQGYTSWAPSRTSKLQGKSSKSKLGQLLWSSRRHQSLSPTSLLHNFLKTRICSLTCPSLCISSCRPTVGVTECHCALFCLHDILTGLHCQCRDALCGLIMGSPPGKVYSKLRSVCSRLNSSY